MQKQYCPSCDLTASATDRCPRCSGRLAPSAEAGRRSPPPDPTRPTLAGRLTAGVLIGLGLVVAVREWALAGLLLIDQLDAWDSPGGEMIGMCLRLAGAVVTGLLAGAGRPKGVPVGMVAGLLLGWLFAMGEAATGLKPGLLTAVSAVGLGVVAAAAAGIGCRVWPAGVDLPPPPPPPGSSSFVVQADKDREKEKEARRPTAWGQLVVGVMICVTSVIAADPVREVLRKSGNAANGMGGASYIPYVDLQLATFGVILGGAVAAASTGSGTRYGLTTGGLAGMAVTAMAAAGFKTIYPVMEGLLRLAGLPSRDLASAEPMMLLAFGVMMAASVGGWLGGTLLPPVVNVKPKGRRFD